MFLHVERIFLVLSVIFLRFSSRQRKQNVVSAKLSSLWSSSQLIISLKYDLFYTSWVSLLGCYSGVSRHDCQGDKYKPATLVTLHVKVPVGINWMERLSLTLRGLTSNGKRQRWPLNLFFSSNSSLNHIKIEKCLLLFATNKNIFTLLFKELKTDGKSFIFAVCGLTYDHVTSNLISLVSIFTRMPKAGLTITCVEFKRFNFHYNANVTQAVQITRRDYIDLIKLVFSWCVSFSVFPKSFLSLSLSSLSKLRIKKRLFHASKTTKAFSDKRIFNYESLHFDMGSKKFTYYYSRLTARSG